MFQPVVAARLSPRVSGSLFDPEALWMDWRFGQDFLLKQSAGSLSPDCGSLISFSGIMSSHVARYSFYFILVAAAYFGVAELGLSQAFLHANVSPVWPPTGVAIAAILLLGYRIAPAILLGAFCANLATDVSLFTAGSIAVGNTLEALVALFLMDRFVGRHHPFYRARDAAKFVVIAGVVATAVSATVGNMVLCLSHHAEWSNFGQLWFTWWLGDAGGALIVAPFIMTWSDTGYDRLSARRSIEMVLQLVALPIIAIVIFQGFVVSMP